MASASIIFSGTYSEFRATVDMTRSYSGTAVQNYETWTITGYVDRFAAVSTSYSRPDAYYELVAGTFAPGQAASGNVAINWTTALGRKFTTAISNMTVVRNTDGTGFNASARFYFYAGFAGVTEADISTPWTVDTVSRSSAVTATSGNIYETDNPSITFTSPAGFPTNVLLRVYDTSNTPHDIATRTSVSSPYTWTLTNTERDAIRAVIPDASSTSFYYVAQTNYGSSTHDDYPASSTLTIDNRGGIASPTFTTWGITDTTSAVAATSGGNPVMVQGKSVARATVTSGNKAVAIKSATMGSYAFSAGGTPQSFAYSSSSNVTLDIDLSTTPTVTGSQTMFVSAIDSRTYSTTVNKSVLVLPYANPAFPATIKIGYTNRFDTAGGISVTLPSGTNLLTFSPLNTGGTDYNVINTASGVQYQLHKNTINSGNAWNNITTATTTGSGVQTTSASTLATSILSTMNSMGADNSVTWYVLFRVTDKYNTNLASSPFAIDIGAPIFRIGVDGYVYNNEKRILTVGDYTPDTWTTLVTQPDLITALGQRSYTVRFPSVDYTDRINKGTRLRLTRTVTAPTQNANLNGTNQYFSKTSPAGMTFTDDFTVSAWVKLNSFAQGSIISRFNGTSGWDFTINSYGQVQLAGFNGGSGNTRYLQSYQSLQLNRWYHVSAQLDMSGFTTTTCKIMIDGVDIPIQLLSAGTNPTSLVQAGNLEVGSRNAGLTPFPGKLAQVAVYSAIVSQSTILASMNQTLTGSESSLISAYTLSNSVIDLNSTNANNLTANGSAVTTDADTPFSQTLTGITGSVNYGIVMLTSFSGGNTTLTVQVPEGGTLPTTGGISASAYSSAKSPYGFPSSRNKWRITQYMNTATAATAISASGVWSGTVLNKFTIPAGDWRYGYTGALQHSASSPRIISAFYTLANSTPTTGIYNQELTTRSFSGATSSNVIQSVQREASLSLASVTTYGVYTATDDAAATISYLFRGDQGPIEIYAENSYI